MHHLYRMLWLSVRAVSHVSASLAVPGLIISAIGFAVLRGGAPAVLLNAWAQISGYTILLAVASFSAWWIAADIEPFTRHEAKPEPKDEEHDTRVPPQGGSSGRPPHPTGHGVVRGEFL